MIELLLKPVFTVGGMAPTRRPTIDVSFQSNPEIDRAHARISPAPRTNDVYFLLSLLAKKYQSSILFIRTTLRWRESGQTIVLFRVFRPTLASRVFPCLVIGTLS